MRPAVAIALIGCGHHAERAHLPVIADRRNGMALATVVETACGVDAARRRLDRFGLGEVPIAVLPEATGSDSQILTDYLRTVMPAVNGAIVSTPAIARGAYLRWLLDHRIPTLAEKPPLVHAGASVSIAAAERLLREFEEVVAHPASALMSIATQRRYNPIYRRIADHCRTIAEAEGQPITFVQASTNDGLWSDDGASHPIHDPLATGGGKLINTGYHLLDIVPWIMRHTNPDLSIASADIACQATRMPGGGAKPGNEVDVALQIAFLDATDIPRCHFQLAALHGGLSKRRRTISSEPAQAWSDIVEGRTKQETLTIFQGPHAAVWMRRIAKLNATAPTGLGSEGHMEVILARNPSLAGSPAIEVIDPVYDDGDSAPTIEFARRLHDRDLILRSPVRDHVLAMRLLCGAYRAMVSGRAVRVRFRREDWSTPPAC